MEDRMDNNEFAFLLHINKDDYLKHQYQKNKANYECMTIFSFIGMILFLIIFMASTIFVNNFCNKGHYIYFLLFLLNFIYYLLINFVLKKYSKYNTLFYYILVFSNLMGFAFLDIKYGFNSVASTLWGAYVLYATMILDYPKRFSTINTAFAFIFCFFVLRLKPYDIAISDVMNCFLFCVVTNLTQTYVSNEKISRFKLIEDIEHQRDTDFLTNLNNRNKTKSFVNMYVENNNQKINALFVVDLDNFKKANDTYGHDYGDKVLKEVANAMKKVFRRTDCISRIGGDEFVVFCPSLKFSKVAELHAKQLLLKIKNINIDNHKVVGASIGIAFSNETDDYHSLFLKADNALYKAKNGGRNCYRIYEDKK
jgi:diguanylate cyclase (GGDEF)-like protein